MYIFGDFKFSLDIAFIKIYSPLLPYKLIVSLKIYFLVILWNCYTVYFDRLREEFFNHFCICLISKLLREKKYIKLKVGNLPFIVFVLSILFGVI